MNVFSARIIALKICIIGTLKYIHTWKYKLKVLLAIPVTFA